MASFTPSNDEILSILSKRINSAKKLKLLRFIKKEYNNELMLHLFDAFGSNTEPLNWQTAWLLSDLAPKRKLWFNGFQGKLVTIGQSKPNSDGVKRNLVRIWENLPLDQTYHFDIADICLEYLKNPKEATAIKAFSLTVLYKLSNHIPELRQELLLEIEKQLPYGSAGFVNRAQKIYKLLHP